MIATALLPWWAWMLIGFVLGLIMFWGWAIVRVGTRPYHQPPPRRWKR